MALETNGKLGCLCTVLTFIGPESVVSSQHMICASRSVFLRNKKEELRIVSLAFQKETSQRFLPSNYEKYIFLVVIHLINSKLIHATEL